MQDAQRLTQWVADHSAAVYGFLLGATGDRAAAEDLLQEVFFRAWSARQAYCERGQARAYLLTIAHRLAADRVRRGRRRERQIDPGQWQLVEPADSRTPAEELTRTENESRLLAALAELSPPQRCAILLRYYGQLSFEQIAATMQAPLGTVLSHCRRGLDALRRLLVTEN